MAKKKGGVPPGMKAKPIYFFKPSSLDIGELKGIIIISLPVGSAKNAWVPFFEAFS